MDAATTKEKTSKPKYTLWQNCAYMIALARKYARSVLWLCLILSALAVVTNLLNLFVTPIILGKIESMVPIGELISTILLFAVGLMIVGAANAYFNTNTLFGRVQIRGALTSMVHVKFMAMSFPLTEDQGLQKELDKAGNAVCDNRQATEAIWGTLTDLMRDAMGFIVYLAFLGSIDPLLISVVTLTAIINFFSSKYINSWGYRHRDEEAEYAHRMRYIGERAGDYTSAKDIRIFGMRGWLEDVHSSALRLYESFIARGERVYIWGNVIDVVLTFLRNGIAYLYLINMVLYGGLSASQFLLYFTAIGGFTAWVSGILSGFSTLHRQSLDISTVREFLEHQELFLFESGEPVHPDVQKPYQIDLRNVSFRYPGAEADALTNINLTIEPREKLAVVGLNGAGKTTLVKLICGFYDPTEGEVLLNGVDIKTYNRRDYYKLFSAVFQDFSLVAGSIALNIAQTDDGIDMERVAQCARQAGISKKIESLSNAYNANLGKDVYEDGIELSGGEMQRLMLARALYKNAPIIVLDEPTAALDPIAESDIYNKYNELTLGRTSVYISHRLASTRFCDRIILIDNNIIAEEGTHESLMAANRKYAELFEIQSRYYREGGFEHGQQESI